MDRSALLTTAKPTQGLSRYELTTREKRAHFVCFLQRHIHGHCSGDNDQHDDTKTDSKLGQVVAQVLICVSPNCHLLLTSVCASCQTYEGGFGGEPFNEAHGTDFAELWYVHPNPNDQFAGGYTYCAVAALTLLGEGRRINLDALLVFVGLFCRVYNWGELS